jgi:hypothetical protein
MSIKLVVAGALLLLVCACEVRPYGEPTYTYGSSGYSGAYYASPGHGYYAGPGGRDGYYRGGEDRR